MTHEDDGIRTLRCIPPRLVGRNRRREYGRDDNGNPNRIPSILVPAIHDTPQPAAGSLFRRERARSRRSILYQRDGDPGWGVYDDTDPAYVSNGLAMGLCR
ncbi:MAG: hypothetical protein ACR2Q4_21340 [Geminicoccaceae bacterium]